MKQTILMLSLAAAIMWLGPVTAHSQSLPAFIRGHLICAINVSRAARINPTYSARELLKYRRVSVPRYGDIAINARPGGYHAQFVLGRGKCANPSSRKQKWVIQDCNATWRGHRKIYVRVR